MLKLTKQLSDAFKRSVYLCHAFTQTADNKDPIRIKLDAVFHRVKKEFLFFFLMVLMMMLMKLILKKET